jgi:N-acetylated-alpha-linked acidic dipeptidase
MTKISITGLFFLACSSLGFAQQNLGKISIKQESLEKQFDANMSAKRVGEHIKLLSSVPHHVGSVGSKKIISDVEKIFKENGWETKIETYQVLFPSPQVRQLEMSGLTNFKAVLKEIPLKEDATSGQADQLPPYNAWSADGDVRGQLVFVNYGLPEDYIELEKQGIDVKGKIVIAKYGRSWRGIKPKVAQEHGAIGCLIYSDPIDDGYVAGDVYPKGAFKNEYMVQRGSIMDMVVYPGDPSTPFKGSKGNVERIKHEDAENLLKIPVLPISYHDAAPLLKDLAGAVVPKSWAGALPFTYHFGPSVSTVHLNLKFDWKITDAQNVIATIKGSEFPDQWVIRGNHHDAWVNGANDPISGLAAELEEAISIGQLLKTGWKPKRTLVYCAWDAEEPGLIGSTEWVEDHQNELKQKAVAYINSDGNARGFLEAQGSHAFIPLMSDVAKSVVDPQTKVSVFERARAHQAISAANPKAKLDALKQQTIRLGAMGSGSDYSSFIQHIGIPSLNISFGGEDEGGEYHSIFDSYDHYARFKDPDFVYGVTLAQTAGRAALRLADADVLPFDFTSLHHTIKGYVGELQELVEQQRDKAKAQNELIATKAYLLAADPREKNEVPKIEKQVPYLDFSPLLNALNALEESAKLIESKKVNLQGAALQGLNVKLYQAEQQMLNVKGLPRRPWYKHTLYAPGFYTGYGVKTVPGVREAIEQKQFDEAQEQIHQVAQSIKQLSNYLNN